ncbi:kinase-like protein [Exidia glandulosa HHB12029]|uniref:Kinase-like protein n=1 Tax=Exidia glandulosa HHB12029 TaxID=1314781 RepID=A0A165CNJ6_EXIGL|nr:kinase-like protein [Exidia glandulosa HHB12029]
MVSPWHKHGDINAYLKEREPCSDALKLKLLTQVLTGLKYLHDLEIVHGDIKGANVLVSDTGEARLADFGFSSILAEHSDSFTDHTSVKGTCRWMAPELFLSDTSGSLTMASDIWACGCLFIEVHARDSCSLT